MVAFRELQLISTSSSTSDSLVAIIPEGTTEKILVSKVLPCQTSNYFVKALDGEFKEAGEQTLRFPGWTSDVIGLFIYWSYKWTLPEFKEEIQKSDSKRATSGRVMMSLVKLWQFGEAHLIPRMQNCAMRVLLDLTQYVHTEAEVLKVAYEGAPTDSALFRFAIREARFEYLDHGEGLSEEGFESLAQVQGFLSDIMRPLRWQLQEDEEEEIPRKWPPAYEHNDSDYIVNEE